MGKASFLVQATYLQFFWCLTSSEFLLVSTKGILVLLQCIEVVDNIRIYHQFPKGQ